MTNSTFYNYLLSQRKNIPICLTLVLSSVAFIVLKIHTLIAYMAIIVFTLMVQKHIPSPKRSSAFSKTTSVLFVLFLFYVVFSYYYRYVRDISDSPNFYRAIATPPVFIALLIAPTIEELGYRRLLLSSLLNIRMHWLIACTISAFLFALAHPDNNQVYAFVLGYFLSYAYRETGNIWVPISMHFLANVVYFIDPSSFGATRVLCDPCIHI